MAPTAEKQRTGEPFLRVADPGPTGVREAGSQIAAAMLEAADPATGEHSDDVELVVDEICKRLAVNGEERENILVAARLHDVGKVAIPREVLEKDGPLDDSEWTLIKEHTLTGERILKTVPELVPVARLVRHSHEHFDGSGYPDGLEGKEIPLGSRIILCADAFHAIRSDRPYRKGRKTPAALEEMRRCAGTQFDPKIVEALDASVKRARRSRRRPLPPRLALLFAMLAIGSGGAFAAERGWIPSPIPGVGPERSAEQGAGADAGAEPAAATTGASADTTSDAAVAGTDEASRNARGSGGGGAADRRGGDRGLVSVNAATGGGHGGQENAQGGDGAPGAGQAGSGGSAGLAPGGAANGAAAGGGSAGASAGGSGGGSAGGSSSGGGGSGSGGGSPSSSGSAPGQTGSTAGQSGSAPGQSGSAPGQSGSNPGGGGAPPGQTGTAPGLSGSSPGQSGSAPGQSAAAPGQGGSAPGQTGAPGNSGNAPGQGGPGGNPHS